MDPTVAEREVKRADELTTGDWLAAMQFPDDGDRPTEVLSAHPYTDGDGPAVLLVVRPTDGVPRGFPADADEKFELATQAELREGQEAAGRAQKIADIRAYIAWLEANPSEPVGYGMGGQVDVPGDPAEAVARVRAFAAQHGGEVRELEDRTSAYVRFGSVDHRVIAWHREGRPAERKPLVISDETIEQAGRMGAWNEREQRWDDPTGLAYSREADDPTPVSPARVPLHTGGMTDGGLVDETDRCVASLHIPTPGATCGWCGAQGMRSAQHVEASAASNGDTYEAECTCGVTVEGFDSFADARAELERHIADATGVPCYAPNGYQAPEVIAERTAACAASHPDRPCTTTSAADLGERADEAIRKTYGEPCQGAPAGFEADCGLVGPHGPHGLLPASES